MRDRAIAHRLLQDPKQLLEHRLTLQAVVEALKPHCSDLHYPTHPEVRSLRTLHHLQTSLQGRCSDDTALFDLAAALHPTPAVAGYPRRAALSRLRQWGDHQRGWYSGFVGWIDRDGNGDLTVLLRCALLDGDRAHLFAGCGIVADSDPAAELAETDLKLAALRNALEQA